MSVYQHDDQTTPLSLKDFKEIFPDDAACVFWLEKSRWRDGFQCPNCLQKAEPFRFANRPTVFRCRKCGNNTSLTVGTVMERTHISLTVWFWGTFLVANQNSKLSITQFQRQLGLSRYETAFQIFHKLRAKIEQSNIGQNCQDFLNSGGLLEFVLAPEIMPTIAEITIEQFALTSQPQTPHAGLSGLDTS